jgi:aconitate hydratase
VSRGIASSGIVAAAVLSGNRNFEGRVNPDVKANYLASPPLVVAYALAGTTDTDLTKDPLGTGSDGRPVMLADVWPTQKEVADLEAAISGEMFRRSYGNVFDGNPTWNAIPVPAGDLFEFQEQSTYIQDPPFFQGLTREPKPTTDIRGARILAILGDSVTTDHISPAGDIALDSPAGRYLASKGVEKKDFNSYGSRRGNDRVMVRGTFANIRLKNLMLPGVEGGVTLHVPSGERMDIYDAAERYRAEGTPLVVIAGKEYGTGSSRDWAAKGTLLRAWAVSPSFERIQQPGGDGSAAPGVRGRAERGIARPHGAGAAQDRGPSRRASTASEARGGGGAAQWVHGVLLRHRPPRHPGRDQLLEERRHPPDRAPQDAQRLTRPALSRPRSSSADAGRL